MEVFVSWYLHLSWCFSKQASEGDYQKSFQHEAFSIGTNRQSVKVLLYITKIYILLLNIVTSIFNVNSSKLPIWELISVVKELSSPNKTHCFRLELSSFLQFHCVLFKNANFPVPSDQCSHRACRRYKHEYTILQLSVGDLAFEWQRGWSWPCFYTDLTAFVM